MTGMVVTSVKGSLGLTQHDQAQLHVQVHKHVCVHVHMHVCVPVHIHAYVPAQVQAHIHGLGHVGVK